MADGDYERGRGREIGAIAAELKRLAEAREGRTMARPRVFVLNGWSASPHAWDLCRFPRERIFSYVEQLDGEPERTIEKVGRCVLVGWSMGGSSALRLFSRWPEKVAGMVLVATTPCMMKNRETGWIGMSERRLDALRYGVVKMHGAGFFGVPEGKPNPYLVDDPGNLERGLAYLLETDVRRDLEAVCSRRQSDRIPVHVFQSERDGIVRSANAKYLHGVFPHATVHIVPGTEHALSISIPEQIDEAVDSCIRLAAAGQNPA